MSLRGVVNILQKDILQMLAFELILLKFSPGSQK